MRPGSHWKPTIFLLPASTQPRLWGCLEYFKKSGRQLIRGLGTEEGTKALQKLVILSQFPASAVILYLGILIYFPEYHSHLILSGDDAADRTFWVQQFQDQPTGAPIQYKGQDQCAPGIIIATSRTSAQGLTLHRSKHIVLLEVD
ncbi:hypothetical protein AKAW_00604 [Aspergillus luchuensis IFO 4308]|nr:hypothetical protein AKAW_00604 [Aspergillus luchuensis IFO 4308]